MSGVLLHILVSGTINTRFPLITRGVIRAWTLTRLVLMDAGLGETGVLDAHESAESSLKQSVSKPRLEADFGHLLKIPPSCRSGRRDPRRPPRKQPTWSLRLYLASTSSSPAARLPPAHGHFLRQLLRVRLITPFLCRSTRSLRRAQSSLMTGATAAVLGSVRARTAARLSQLHSTVSSQIPLKGPLRDQISPGAPARACARAAAAAAAAPSPPPPCAQELFGIFRKSWLRVLFWDVNTDLC